VTACVLDASVAAKWYLPPDGEKYVEQAERLGRMFAAGGLDMVAPDILWPELGNVLWKAVKLRRMPVESARDAIGALAQLTVTSVPSRPLLRHAFEIGAEFHCAIYDAIYVSLAASLNIPLVTADEPLVKALGSRFPVRWLGALA